MIFLLLLVFPASVFGQGRTIEYTVDGKPYEGNFVSAGENSPFILLVHGWDGLTEYEIKRAEMLADEGYTVFAGISSGRGGTAH